MGCNLLGATDQIIVSKMIANMWNVAPSKVQPRRAWAGEKESRLWGLSVWKRYSRLALLPYSRSIDGFAIRSLFGGALLLGTRVVELDSIAFRAYGGSESLPFFHKRDPATGCEGFALAFELRGVRVLASSSIDLGSPNREPSNQVNSLC